MIAFGRPNLLLLDEPTNHLDLEMRHALTVALQSFEGAVIVVSHDRHLLKNTVDEFWLVAEGKVELFKGDLADYEKWLVDYQRGLSAPSAGGAEGVASGEDKKERKRREAEARKRLSPLKNELKKVEQSMQRVQKTLAEIEAALGDNDLYSDANKDKLKNTFSRQAEAKNELDSLELNWFELSEQIEELEPLDS